ncbi:MAG: ABC transporter substrate-binding protein [Desulfobacteraceae bacterium]|nr:ABC transporter substrate-binding protein [Desulfobacteraceae bacterium]
MITNRWVMLILALSLLCAAPAVCTEKLSPIETLKKPIEKVTNILHDPAFKNSGKKNDQRNVIWKVAGEMFDFTEISRRTIGKKAWKTFTSEEKEQFIKVFSEFLGNTYISKIQGEYQNEQIIFLNELVRGNIALVRTKLKRASLEIPIDYRMKKIEGNWKIYDVLVENGVSIIKNYHIQFKSILRKESPQQLIERLEKKLVARKS